MTFRYCDHVDRDQMVCVTSKLIINLHVVFSLLSAPNVISLVQAERPHVSDGVGVAYEKVAVHSTDL